MSEEATQSVVTTTDLAKKKPTSFRDLNKAELVEAARAFGTKDEGNVKELREDLADAGVTWEMYCRQFGIEHWENEAPPVVETFNRVDEDDPNVEFIDGEGVNEEVTQEIITAAPQTFANEQKYLIKFIGQNPYFEFGRYRFTQDKPYGIMSARDAQSALVNEPSKFRQAFPAELEEFYG